MKKVAISFVFISLFVVSCTMTAQEKNCDIYSLGFYNLENLFDTIHDAGKNDYEYLPRGVMKWGSTKYANKIKNMATVLRDMSAGIQPMGLAAVGVSEIENRRVLNDLVSHEVLADRAWNFIHLEGPDTRGIDCALLYNPKLFKPETSCLVPYTKANSNKATRTRGFLVVSGSMAGERIHIIVTHWPSRYSKSPARERAGVLVRSVKDSLLSAEPDSKVVIMGDMNDNPDNKSMKTCLGAFREQNQVKQPSDLYNPWWNILRNKGMGTIKYRGKWNLFDQIIVNGNLLGNDNTTLKFYKSEIFSRSYMLQQKGKYKDLPKRTHADGVWLNGYSDHFPVIIYLIKEHER